MRRGAPSFCSRMLSVFLEFFGLALGGVSLSLVSCGRLFPAPEGPDLSATMNTAAEDNGEEEEQASEVGSDDARRADDEDELSPP